MVTDLINQARLPFIKTAIDNKTYIKLRDFINLSRLEYHKNGDISYSESWSLIYFLVNGKSGKYKDRLKAYIEVWKTKKIDVKIDGNNVLIQNKDTHIKVFEKCMSIPIDDLENEWKEYILGLK
jgi:hypothetical protein